MSCRVLQEQHAICDGGVRCRRSASREEYAEIPAERLPAHLPVLAADALVVMLRIRWYAANMKTLDHLVDEHIAAMRSSGLRPGTIRNAQRVCKLFMAHTGNIQVKHVTARHVDSYFAMRLTRNVVPETLNMELSILRTLFKTARLRAMCPAHFDPTAHRRPLKTRQKPKRRIPATEFPRMLDSAKHPRDRVALALSIYLLTRQSEMAYLRVGDVNLTNGELSVTVIKTGKFDVMPICAELDAELRRWLTWYSQRCGPLRDDWYLVPAKAAPGANPGRKGFAGDLLLSRIYPTRPMGRPEQIVQRALEACGYATRKDDGSSMRDGVHTLRRSAARELFDRLCEEGYDGAGRVVQSALHHSSFQQTETYLGIELDQKRRDDLIRGKSMFPIGGENVVRLEAVK